MTEGEAELWARIEADPLPMSRGLAPEGRIGVDPSISLEDLLLREANLSGATLEQAMLEYRRFLMVAARPAGGSSLPAVVSGTIAQIFARHRADRLAWQHMCQNLLGIEPEKSPEKLTRRHYPAYAETLARYRQLFNEDPTPRLWPSLFRLKLRRSVPKLFWLAGVAVFFSVVSAIYQVSKAPEYRDKSTGDALMTIAFFFMFVAFIIYLIVDPWKLNGDDGGAGGGVLLGDSDGDGGDGG